MTAVYAALQLRTLSVVWQCLGIRHPEELSLARQLDNDELKRNQGISAVRRTQIPGMTSSPNGHAPANNSYDSGTLSSPYRTTLTPQVSSVHRVSSLCSAVLSLSRLRGRRDAVFSW